VQVLQSLSTGDGTVIELMGVANRVSVWLHTDATTVGGRTGTKHTLH
jgi:hypothetical protein